MSEDSKTYNCTQDSRDHFFFRPATSSREVVLDATGGSTNNLALVEVIVSRDDAIDMVKYLMEELDIRPHELEEEEIPDEASQKDKN